MARGRAGGRGRGRKAATAPDAPPDVFRDMLGELGPEASDRARDEQVRPNKRRRLGQQASGVQKPTKAAPLEQKSNDKPQDKRVPALKNRDTSSEPELQQIAFNPAPSSSEEEDSDEFEDVELGSTATRSTSKVAPQGDSSGGASRLELVLKDGITTDKAQTRKRRSVTVISDKRLTKDAHKIHVLCLLSHIALRNYWCNDQKVQKSLRKLVPRVIREELEDDPTEDQYTRDQKLRSGLRRVVERLKDAFTVNAKGLRRSWWDAPENEVNPPSLDDLDIVTSLDDFRTCAATLAGSRDVGAQLLTAALRGIGLDVRLVCSLQPLPINGSVRPQAPMHQNIAHVVRYEDLRTEMRHSGSEEEPEADDAAYNKSSIRRRLHGGSAHSSPTGDRKQPKSLPATSMPSDEPKRFQESSHPIFWTEVFSPAYQKWLSIDALVTGTVGQPTKLEPAQKDIRNAMSYVVGFEEDGSFRDVTRRYASWYNAKTRKARIDSKSDSDDAKWWKRIVRAYSRPLQTDSDAIEDAEMQRREEREGMPKNVEDFKGHPRYVLERHVRRNEVIHPKREAGRTGAGQAGDEAVFRRSDVHTVKSADAWYRLGREVKVGEQPLKRAIPKRKGANATIDADEETEDEDGGQGLYAAFQTKLYRAPPAKNGRVPRNAYGNLDVYVPSMIPPGSVHFVHPKTKDAAKILGIDSVDAVTGFEFRGRQGNPIVRGALVAAEYKEAVLEVLQAMYYAKASAEAASLQRECLRLWRRFIVGLRINERVAGYNMDDPSDSDDTGSDGNYDPREAMDEDEQQADLVDQGGGFLAEAHVILDKTPAADSLLDMSFEDFRVFDGPTINAVVQQQSGTPAPKQPLVSHDSGPDDAGGFMPDDAGGFMPDESASLPMRQGGSVMPGQDENRQLDGGGFVYESLEDNSQLAGAGFMTEDTNTAEEKPLEKTSVPPPQPDLEAGNAQQLDLERFSEPESRIQKVVHGDPEVELASEPASGPLPFVAQTSEAVEAALDKSEEDRGSLFSEDPEDVDADPDWLV